MNSEQAETVQEIRGILSCYVRAKLVKENEIPVPAISQIPAENPGFSGVRRRPAFLSTDSFFPPIVSFPAVERNASYMHIYVYEWVQRKVGRFPRSEDLHSDNTFCSSPNACVFGKFELRARCIRFNQIGV